MNDTPAELRVLAGHAFLGACWGLLYWLTVSQTEYVYSLRSLVFGGLLIGGIFGFITILVLMALAENVRVMPAYTVIVFVLYVLVFTYLSPTSEYYLFNVIAATFGSWLIVLRAYRSDYEPKEKRKNA